MRRDRALRREPDLLEGRRVRRRGVVRVRRGRRQVARAEDGHARAGAVLADSAAAAGVAAVPGITVTQFYNLTTNTKQIFSPKNRTVD